MNIQLSAIARFLEAEQIGRDCIITGIAPVQSASAGDISFIDNPTYKKHLLTTKASAVIISKDLLSQCPEHVSALVVDNPYLAYAKAAQKFSRKPKYQSGVSPSAVIAESADIADDVYIGPNVVIGDRTQISAGVSIGAGCVIQNDCIIGPGTQLYPNVTLYHDVVIGSYSHIHSGVVIGADGFGITKEKGRWIQIPQIAGVKIGDYVLIGANTTIDRGALEPTLISDNVMLDNQIQIGHNVKIGPHTAIAGCVAIAGSATIGRDCIIGGGVCIAGHISITDNVSVTGMSAVFRSINEPGVYTSGTALQPTRHAKRNALRYMQLDSLFKRLQSLEKEVEELKSNQIVDE